MKFKRQVQPLSHVSIIVCAVMMLAISPAMAAQLGDIRVMDELAAGMRAVAAQDPDEKIRNPDNLAAKFLSPAFWFWTALDADYAQSQKFIKFYRVSSYYTHNACTKHIDGILTTAVGKGLRQVVIIGAGLDSRPYRFHLSMPEVRFFEVDLPATVERKQALVRTVIGTPPSTVNYVALDYRQGAIESALNESGYDPAVKTVFICETVTRYIDASAVDRILRFVTDNAAAGSELVFDYIFEDIANGDFSKMPWARFQAVRVSGYGYPWKFGIAPSKAAHFVSSRGFDVISDLDAGQLAQRYLVRSDGTVDGRPTPYVRILHAVVKE